MYTTLQSQQIVLNKQVKSAPAVLAMSGWGGLLRKALQMEEWKDIIGFEGIYKVSKSGVVKRYKGILYDEDRALKHQISSSGYLCVYLTVKNKKKYFAVHRLIAIHFIPNNDNLPCINHKDSNRLNNSVDNLEWCTRKENTRFRRKVSTTKNFKGVYKTPNNTYAAKTKVDGVDVCLGTFKNELDAANAYDKAAIKYFGRFALTNAQLRKGGSK